MSKPGTSDSLSSLWSLLKRLVMPSLFFLFFLGFLIVKHKKIGPEEPGAEGLGAQLAWAQGDCNGSGDGT